MWNTRTCGIIGCFPHPSERAFAFSSCFPSSTAAKREGLVSNVCLNSSPGPKSSLVFRLYSDIILYLDRLSISYAIIQGVCEIYRQRWEEVGAIKQPGLSFPSEPGDIFFNRRVFFVSSLLLGYRGAQFNAVFKKKKKREENTVILDVK